MLTVTDIMEYVPTKFKNNITQQLVDKINSVSQDENICNIIKNNFLSYSIVLKDGKFTIDEYLNAVMYISYKLMGYNNRESYIRTFPDRFKKMKMENRSDKDIAAYITAYNKGKLVNLIYEQTAIPTWVINQDVYQQAINQQADLMLNAKSEFVRTQAANSLLTHLKKPEKADIGLNINLPDSSGLKELTSILNQVADFQSKNIIEGQSLKNIVHTDIINITPNSDED
jgi:hypothetical protein